MTKLKDEGHVGDKRHRQRVAASKTLHMSFHLILKHISKCTKMTKKIFETNTCQQFLVIRAGPCRHGRSFRTAELTPVPGSGSNRTSSYPHTRSLPGGEALRGTPPGQGQQLIHRWVPGSFVIQCRCSRGIYEFSLLILEAGWLHLERLSLHNERMLDLRGHPPALTPFPTVPSKESGILRKSVRLLSCSWLHGEASRTTPTHTTHIPTSPSKAVLCSTPACFLLLS